MVYQVLEFGRRGGCDVMDLELQLVVGACRDAGGDELNQGSGEVGAIDVEQERAFGDLRLGLVGRQLEAQMPDDDAHAGHLDAARHLCSAVGRRQRLSIGCAQSRAQRDRILRAAGACRCCEASQDHELLHRCVLRKQGHRRRDTRDRKVYASGPILRSASRSKP